MTRQDPAGALVAIPVGVAFAKVMTRLKEQTNIGNSIKTNRQFCLGQAILVEEALQINRQLQGQRTYLKIFPNR